MVAQRDVLQIAPCVYPFMRSDIRTYFLSKSEMNLCADNVFNGKVPHKLIVALVASKGYNGDYKKNPFNFENFDVKDISFSVNGQNVPNEMGFHPDFTKGIYTEEYLALNGDRNGDIMWFNGINLSDFEKGYAIYVFNIRSENELQKKGLTKLNISFKKELPEAVTAIVYGQFPDCFQIDQYNKLIQS